VAYTLCMSHNFILKISQILLFMLFAGCSNYKDDVIAMPQVDAGVFESDMSGTCISSLGIDSSISCLTCPEWCENSDTDLCDPGTRSCVCGIEGRSCGELEECRYGRCIPQNSGGGPCEFDSVCRGDEVCIEGRCSPAGCRPEMCNGYDDDCDGLIDNLGPGPLARWCLGRNIPADNIMSTLPPCRIGSQICAGGEWQECLGSIPAIPEVGTLACDGIDNNCDGCIDGHGTVDSCMPPIVSGYDIVLAIDTSGSMRSYIDAVRAAINLFAINSLSPVGSRFALIVFPTRNDRDWLVVSDFTTMSAFQSHLAGVLSDGGGNEGSYDVLYGVMSGFIPLSWRVGANRVIIMLGDEAAQSYLSPPITERTMCEAKTNGEIVAVVTEPIYYSMYDDCTETFALSEDESFMANNLSAIIRDPCN